MYENQYFKFELKKDKLEDLLKGFSAMSEKEKDFQFKYIEKQIGELISSDILGVIPEAVKTLKSDYKDFLKDLDTYSS